MKRYLLFVLLLALLAETPFDVVAQKGRKTKKTTKVVSSKGTLSPSQPAGKTWAVYSNGSLSFTMGAKPQQPSQVDCSSCNQKNTFSSNFCSNCGAKLKKDFIVCEAERFTVNGVIFAMVPVQGGTFTMGATSEQGSDVWDHEKPAHKVTVSSFSIGQTEVTQELWQAVMGNNPSEFKGAKRPVEKVSWDDCQEFLRKLNAATGKHFRLPTEAEWEYAARGGNLSKDYKYSGSNSIGSVAWYYDNSGSQTHPVATKSPNELGIFDMSGNVWEWCQDWYGDKYYGSSPSSNPIGPSSGSYRVNRGGSWFSDAGVCRVSSRDADSPDYRFINLGLRLAL